MTCTCSPWTELPLAACSVWSELQRRAEERPQPRETIALGVPSLDLALGALHPGELVLVCSSSTAERLSLLVHCSMCAAAQHWVGIASFDHPADRIAWLALAAWSGVPLARMSSGALERVQHWPALADALESLHTQRVALLQPPAVELGALRDAVQSLKAERPDLSLVAIDGIHRLPHDGTNPNEALGALARELGVLMLVGQAPHPQKVESVPLADALDSRLPWRSHVRAAVMIPRLATHQAHQAGLADLTLEIADDRPGTVSTVTLQHDPLCLAWRDPQRSSQGAGNR